MVEEALARHPLESMAPLNRPYTDLARPYAYLGQPQRARASIAEYQAAIDLDLRRRDQFDPRYTLEGGAGRGGGGKIREKAEARVES